MAWTHLGVDFAKIVKKESELIFRLNLQELVVELVEVVAAAIFVTKKFSKNNKELPSSLFFANSVHIKLVSPQAAQLVHYLALSGSH